jgi:hypothetical protein
MLQLKSRIIECEHPVGTKKTTNWKLPPIDFIYGKENKPDPEGVGIGRLICFKFLSYTKLESS